MSFDIQTVLLNKEDVHIIFIITRARINRGMTGRKCYLLLLSTPSLSLCRFSLALGALGLSRFGSLPLLLNSRVFPDWHGIDHGRISSYDMAHMADTSSDTVICETLQGHAFVRGSSCLPPFRSESQLPVKRLIFDADSGYHPHGKTARGNAEARADLSPGDR